MLQLLGQGNINWWKSVNLVCTVCNYNWRLVKGSCPDLSLPSSKYSFVFIRVHWVNLMTYFLNWFRNARKSIPGINPLKPFVALLVHTNTFSWCLHDAFKITNRFENLTGFKLGKLSQPEQPVDVILSWIGILGFLLRVSKQPINSNQLNLLLRVIYFKLKLAPWIAGTLATCCNRSRATLLFGWK